MSEIFSGDVLNRYDQWGSPDLIISDGAYGVGGFAGDPRTPARLIDWYKPHVKAWTLNSNPGTSLFFWCTEVGWATVHPLLVEAGWEYVETVVWDKGVNHIAGNVNGKTIRQFPVVTEISVLYRRPPVVLVEGLNVPVQQWLRNEWLRSGLKLNQANIACGVNNAATRKYLSTDEEWYMPPGEMVVKLAEYANQYGDPAGAPYFSIPGGLTVNSWETRRGTWNHTHGLTNVWSHPPLKGEERVKVNGKPFHGNQKPLMLMERQIVATTNPGGVVWEPFGGLGSASVAAKNLGREYYVAEINPTFFNVLSQRLV